MSHTPGPWSNRSDKGTKFGSMALVATGDGPMCIDCTGSGATHAESLANARLIAAAPELLAAMFSIMNNEHACAAMTTPQHTAAIAAIDKAIGEATPAGGR